MLFAKWNSAYFILFVRYTNGKLNFLLFIQILIADTMDVGKAQVTQKAPLERLKKDSGNGCHERATKAC